MKTNKVSKCKKVFEITVGFIDDEEEEPNWRKVKAVSTDAVNAISKVKLGSHEYICEVRLVISLGDVL